MTTKKNKTSVPVKLLNKAVNTTKNVASMANDYALNATETVVTDSLEVTAQWQIVASKALKGGFKLAANQQEIVFDTLTGVKSQIKLGRKRFTKLMA